MEIDSYEMRHLGSFPPTYSVSLIAALTDQIPMVTTPPFFVGMLAFASLPAIKNLPHGRGSIRTNILGMIYREHCF
jgi:hypothetical protein